MWRHGDYGKPCPRLALPVPTEPDLSLQEAARLLRRALRLAGPCCCHHCPSPSGHGFQERILRVLPRDGGDRAAHGAPELPFGRGMWCLPLPRFQGPAAVTKTFQRDVGLSTPWSRACPAALNAPWSRRRSSSLAHGSREMWIAAAPVPRVLLLLLPLALEGLCPW